MEYCAVRGCNSNSLNAKKVKFFPFPSTSGTVGKVRKILKKRRKKWREALRRDDLTKVKMKFEKVCSLHFISGGPSRLGDFKNEDWVPSLNLDNSSEGPSNCRMKSIIISRTYRSYEEAIKQKAESNGRSKPASMDESSVIDDHSASMAAMEIDIKSELCAESVYKSPDELAMDVANRPAHQADHCYTSKMVQEVAPLDESSQQGNINNEEKALLSEYNIALRKCHEEIYKLREELNLYTISPENMKKDPDICKFYTSLDYCLLMEIHETVAPHIFETHSSRLTSFQQLVLCLMRLKWNFNYTDLGFRFNVSRRTASSAYDRVLTVLKHMKIVPFQFSKCADKIRSDEAKTSPIVIKVDKQRERHVKKLKIFRMQLI